MANVITVKMAGVEGVLKTLESLPPEIVSKNGGPIRFALRKAAVVIQKQVKENLQAIINQPNIGGQDKSTGFLLKNVVVRRGKFNQARNGETYRVRFSGKSYPNTNGVKKSTAQIARLLEYGTEKRVQYPFIRPAFESKKNEALQTFVDTVNKRIKAIVKKLERENRVKS